jgi:PadR family transcriptional regulator PadR
VRIDRELMRGAGPMALLRLLESRPMYGYELVEALAAVRDGVLDMGQSTLYPMLYNLESKKLLAASWQTADSGRRRKYYRITAKGRRWLESQKRQWQDLMGAMSDLGVISEAGGGATK